MKRALIGFLLVSGAVVMGLFGGCSETDDPATVDETLYTREQAADINDPYGGYNLADEAAGFDDPVLLEEYGDDVAYTDPFEKDPVVRELDRDREGRLRGELFLAITWGNLHWDSTITKETDWSGSLRVEPGVILLKQTIRFEIEDYILPRTERSLLEWVSHTNPHYDGVLVKIVACPPKLSVTNVQADIDSANTIITFSTGPLTVRFTLADLPGLHRIVTLDDGNAVSFDAVCAPPVVCPRGFLHGIWKNHPDREGGVFFGKYASENSTHMGYVRGFYGVNKNGEKVFFGKWISRNGAFCGILRGTYGDTVENKAGYFTGHWVGRDLRIHGQVKGEWRRDDDHRCGFFRGEWATDCFVRL
jgi:hypothetical protein